MTLIALAPVVSIVAAIALSRISFFGGYHFAYWQFLDRARDFNKHMENSDSVTLAKWNEVLKACDAKKTGIRMRDWFFHYKHMRDS